MGGHLQFAGQLQPLAAEIAHRLADVAAHLGQPLAIEHHGDRADLDDLEGAEAEHAGRLR